MNKKFCVSNKKGFTLVEVLAVMVIMSVMVSVGAKKIDLLSHNASDRVLEQGIRELNTRETLVWTKIKLSAGGGIIDADVFAALDTDLGHEFKWTVGPDITGGYPEFQVDIYSSHQSRFIKFINGRWN